ncbi:MAG: hypothetical protein ACE5K0_00295 [Candidatus Methanofastidiosia archaeon]
MLRRLFGRREDLGEKLYFSHPTLTFHTKTERECLEFLRSKFRDSKIINPADYGFKGKGFFENLISSSRIVCGLVIFEKYTYGVLKEMEYGVNLGKEVYTIASESKEEFFRTKLRLKEGMPSEYERLSWEQTKKLYSELQKKSYRGFFSFHQRRLF